MGILHRHFSFPGGGGAGGNSLKPPNFLVGGWTTHLKNISQNDSNFPNVRGENKKYVSCHHLHPWNLNLKRGPWKRRFLLETIIFRFHVKFQGSSNSCVVSFFHPKKIFSSQAHHATLETPHLRSHPFPWEKTDFWRGSQGTKKKIGREFLDRFFYESVKVLQDFDVISNTQYLWLSLIVQ